MGESALAKQLRLDVAQLTDVGRKREHNEDNMAYVIPKDPQVMAAKGALFIVADGMGGHAAGEVASEIAVDTVSNTYYQDDSDDVAGPLLQAIKRANSAIHQRAAENMLRSGMGTTCVAAVLRGNMAYIANVGDSRAYIVRGNQVRQISQDHSWVAEQVRAGLLTEEQARTHAQRNVITRCLGTQPDVEVDVFRERLEEGDSLVLCTDGLSGLISDEELKRIVAQFVPQESVYHLVERANENGGPDNITAIVVRVMEVGVEPPGVRHAVGIGGREVGAAEISSLDTLPGTTPLGIGFGSSNGDIRPAGTPFQISSGPLGYPDSITAPQPAVAKRQRSRLFYPTLLFLFIFLAAAIGGGIFYYLHLNQSQSINQALDHASQLINQAKGEDPAHALKDLASAQSALRNVQKKYQLDGTQTTRLNQLQQALVSQTKQAIGGYNTAASIFLLPCGGTTTQPFTGANSAAQSLVTLSVNNHNLLYALAQDGGIYQITSQNSLQSSVPSSATSRFLSLASDGTHLFALSEQLKNGTAQGYSVSLFTSGADGKLTQPVTTGIDGKYTKGGFLPSLTTAWGGNVYVVLTNQNQAEILDYASDNKNQHINFSKVYNFSISAPISSVAAFPDQLFLLYGTGAVQSLQLTSGNQSFLPGLVLLDAPIAAPLSSSSTEFTASKDVPAVAPVIENGNVPLTIPSASSNIGPILSAGMVERVPHLYIGDSLNHRILDLMVASTVVAQGTPSPTATSTGTQTSKVVTLHLERQYVSPTMLATMKSVVVDPQGVTLDVLAQGTGSPVPQLVTLNTGTPTGCAV
jgi:serine/threonine protein phosphatase PrpC